MSWSNLISRVTLWQRRPKTAHERCDMTPLMRRFFEQALLTRCKNKPEDAEILTNRYANLIGVFALGQDFECASAGDMNAFECIRVEENTIHFHPANIDVEDVHAVQKYQLVLFRDLWMAHQHINIVVDLTEMSLAKVGALLKHSTSEDMCNGIDSWVLLPCRVRSIRIIEPKYLPGWFIFWKFADTMLNKKTRDRLTLSRAEAASCS